MRHRYFILFVLAASAMLIASFVGQAQGVSTMKRPPMTHGQWHKGMVTQAMREAAAERAKQKGLRLHKPAAGKVGGAKKSIGSSARVANRSATAAVPGGTPDYFGADPNYANSPLPPTISFVGGDGSGASAEALVVGGVITGISVTNGGSGYTAPPDVVVTSWDGSGALAHADLDASGSVADVVVDAGGSGYGGIRKFVDPLPIPPLATPDTTTYPGSDYYEIELGEYTQQMHPDLPPTTLRGYRQVNMGGTPFSYLGPVIVAQRDRPVRVKFINSLPTGAAGNLFLPVDTSVMGAGKGPNGGTENYTQNRATLHLHGGTTPWISDGTQHQWITPAGETTSYPQGVSVRNVPDMKNPDNSIVGSAATDGIQTFYYTNQQSARLLFYHDHAYGITRLNVYAGEAAGYLLTDNQEAQLINAGTIPGSIGVDEFPLVIQDKTFVPGPNQLAAQDPTWNNGGLGSLWFPHVYMPNQNPSDTSGANAMGRWDYGPWFWPPFTGITNGPVSNPLYDPANAPWEPAQNPGTPNPSLVPEGFMDTPVVNGEAYPTLDVPAGPTRFRVLNAANDRFWNLSLWLADGTTNAVGTNTEVKMVPFNSSQNQLTPFPAPWYDRSVPNPFDDRVGGVPDPNTRGPAMIQIGNEAGFLPAPMVIKNQPINYVMNKRDITVGNVAQKALFLGPAERADVVVDFSQFAGQTLILYNDAPAPVPASDPRNDYFTGDPDLTDTGGAPSTLPGYGPNTRTIMQIRVAGVASQATNCTALNACDATPSTLAAMQTDIPAAYGASQRKPLVPNAAYNQAFGANYPTDSYTRIQDTKKSFTSDGVGTLTLTNPGSGYLTPVTVTFAGGGGTAAKATATLAPTSVNSFTVTNGGSGYTAAPNVTLSGGGGSGATATAVLSAAGSVKGVTITSGGNNYTAAPTVVFTGGGGSGATATAVIANKRVTSVTVTNGGAGYTTAPTVSFTGGGGSGAAATATIGRSVAGVTRVNGGSGYTSAPTVAFSGGGGSGAAATATLAPSGIGSVTLVNGGTGYIAAPTVSFSGANGSGTGASANAALLGVTVSLEPKSIIENFDPDFGRMNALLGVEVPNTTGLNQTSIPYADVDPPTEVFKNSAVDADLDQVPIASAPDGTQVWKITHNGVDTHAMHWHMFDVQVINRVGWDGAIRPPDPNELGWKDTVRMNPLEDIIVALRPIMPNIPFDVPNSVRMLDPTMPAGPDPNLGSQTNGLVDPNNRPVTTVTNHLINFGWEYVWHCHLLGHEENIMMRAVPIAVQPKPPLNVTAATSGSKNILVSWKDNSVNETGYDVYRKNGTGGFQKIGSVAVSPTSTASTGTGATVTFTDTTPVKGSTYTYRVDATNTAGDTATLGFSTATAESSPSPDSNTVTR